MSIILENRQDKLLLTIIIYVRIVIINPIGGYVCIIYVKGCGSFTVPYSKKIMDFNILNVDTRSQCDGINVVRAFF